MQGGNAGIEHTSIFRATHQQPEQSESFPHPSKRAGTCDEDHNYNDEQAAVDGGLMDKFVEKLSCNDQGARPTSTMGYYDGNTVTAMWN